MRELIDLLFNRISELLEDSRIYRNNKRTCKSCERLMYLLEAEKREKLDLVSRISHTAEGTKEELTTSEAEFKPITPPNWRKQRFDLENNARERAAKLREEYELIQSGNN